MVRDDTVERFLGRLADRSAAPAGGSVAALFAAQAAALLGMAARFSEQEAMVKEADSLRERSVDLAEEDAKVFETVAAAYRLPQGDERDRAIRDGLAEAAVPPVRVVAVARELVDLAERLLPLASDTLAPDVAAAAAAAQTALSAGRLNAEADLAGLEPGDRRLRLLEEVGDVDLLVARASAVYAEARWRVTR